MSVPGIEVEGHVEADREDIDIEVHHDRVELAHEHLVVNLLEVVVRDAHDAGVDLDGHVVCRESHVAGRDAEREAVAGLVGSLHGRVVRELGLRTAGRELHLVEECEALAVAQRDVLPPDHRGRVAVCERVEVPSAELRGVDVVAEFQRGVVELEQRPRIDEAGADGHVVAQGVGDHRTDAEGVAFGVDVLDDEELVAVVGMGRVGGRPAEDPLALGHEEVVSVGQAAAEPHLVDGHGTSGRCGEAVGGLLRGVELRRLRLRRQGRAGEAQRRGERRKNLLAHGRAFYR